MQRNVGRPPRRIFAARRIKSRNNCHMPPSQPSSISVPITQILLVDEILRPQTGAFRSESTPGHLLHVVVSGQVAQKAEGRPEAFGAGQVVWYHECEPITGRITRAPWRFITIHFSAPGLVPPPDEQRVMPAGARTLELARRLLKDWRSRSLSPPERAFRCTATLAELLLDCMPMTAAALVAQPGSGPAADRWWAAEKQLRLHLDRPLDLAGIARQAGMSARTANRACKVATGMTPLQRLKQLRLAHAHGLLQHSQATITEIAMQVGYARVQELSRDMKRHYGATPRAIRQRLPDYRTLRRE